jgi:hypothetical protein
MNRLLVMMLLLMSAFPVRAAGMFGQGSAQIALLAGNGYAFDQSYFIIGASAGYYVRDGLGIGLSFEHWSGSGPGINKYAPFAQYVFYQAFDVQPYAGGFYRHTAVDGLPGINSLGARAGVYIPAGSSAYFGAGLIYESYLDCQTAVYRNCSETYPDLSFTFAF